MTRALIHLRAQQEILDFKMANVLLVGCGGIGTIAALNLQTGGKARVTTVLRSNYDHVKQHGFHIRSLDHGVVESFRPDISMPLPPSCSLEDANR